MDLKAHVELKALGYHSVMTNVSRKSKTPELCWVLRRSERSRHRRLVFEPQARAYLWRTRRELSSN